MTDAIDRWMESPEGNAARAERAAYRDALRAAQDAAYAAAYATAEANAAYRAARDAWLAEHEEEA